MATKTKTKITAADAAKRFNALDLAKVDGKVADELNLIAKETDHFADEEVFYIYVENFLDLLALAEREAAGSEKTAPKSRSGNGGAKKPPTRFDNGKSIEECEEIVKQAESAARQMRQEAKLNDYRAELIGKGMSKEDAAKLTIDDLPKPTVTQKVKDGALLLVQKVVDNKFKKVKGLNNEHRAELATLEEEWMKEAADRITEYVKNRGEEVAERLTKKAKDLKAQQADA